MVWTQDVFSERQGSPVKGFGLLVLALLVVENAQIIERRGHLEMHRSQRLLSDGEHPLKERLSQTIGGVFTEVNACPV
jgi:hypothetical protein